jgi:cysteine desulfurase / selenocysteine lyase
MPDSGITYLNNAATSWPKPKPVLSEVIKCVKNPCSGGRSTSSSTDYPSICRTLLGGFFSADPEKFVYTRNATEALNQVIHGFMRKNRGPVHVISTNLEHNSVLRPLYTLQTEGKIRLEIVEAEDGYLNIETLNSSITLDTGLLAFTHGSNVIGTLQDAGKICALMSEKGVKTLVDGSQTAGHIPLNIDRMGCDYLAYTGHKGLYAMQGIGGYYIREPESIMPIIQGGTGADSQSLTQPEKMPHRLESGTPNYPGIASLYAGIKYVQAKNPKKIHEAEMRHTRGIIGRLTKADNIIIYNRNPDLPVVSFNIIGLPCQDLGMLLEADGIIGRAGLHCAPLIHEKITGGAGCMRLSPSTHNNRVECIKASEKILSIAQALKT